MFSYSGILIGFVYLIFVLPAALSKEELGLSRFLLSASVLLGTLFTLGLGAFTLRFFPQFRDSGTGHHGFLRLILFISALGFLLMSVLLFIFKGQMARWFSDSHSIIEYGYLVLPMAFSLGMFSVVNAYCMALFRTAMGSFLNDVFIRLLLLALALFHLAGWISFEIFLYSTAGAFLLQLIAMLIYVMLIDNGLQHAIDWRFIRSNNARSMFTYLVYLAPAGLASMALRQIDTVLLGSNIAGEGVLEGVAIFSVAVTIAVLIDAPAASLGRISDAKISDAIHRRDFSFISRTYHSSVRLLAVIGGLLYVGILINLQNLWQVMPDDYSGGTVVVYILGFSAFVNMATGVNGSLLTLSEHFRKVARLLFVLVVLSVLLNLWLIPHYGIMGAAIASAVSMVSYNVCKTWMVWREFKVQPLDRSLLIVMLLMTACYFLNNIIPTVFNPWLDSAMRSAIILLVYSLVCFWTGLIPELSEILATVRKRLGVHK